MPRKHFPRHRWEFTLRPMLSMKAKYALRALTVLGRHAPATLPAHAVAAQARVPEKFLETILLDLRRAGFLASRRGADGGHALARPAGEIALGDVIRAIDGPLAPIRCASLTAYRPCEDCPDPEQCAVRALMREVRGAIAGVLDARSLQDQLDLDAAGVEPGRERGPSTPGVVHEPFREALPVHP